MSQPLKHTHTCIKCSKEYTHTHPARSSKHEQFPHQCPNPECVWFIESGKGKAVETEGYSPKAKEEKTTIKNKDNGGPTEVRPPSDLSPLQKAVKFAYSKGQIQCDVFNHFTLVHKDGDKFPTVTPKHARHMLEEMVPYVDSKCICQTRALAEGSKFNYHGMPQTQYVCFGATQKGAGNYTPGMPAKKVFPIKYSLNEAQLKTLRERHPDWLFITTVADGHDHPIAHTSTAVNSWNMMEKVSRGTSAKPTQVLDLYGNPGSNEQFNARQDRVHVTTNCFAWSAKDEGRLATKWGKPVVDGKRRYYKADLRSLEGLDQASPECPKLESFDEVVSIHALYHFSPNELCRLMNVLPEGVPLHAIMHKFEPGNRAGTINGGEQKWERFEQNGERWVKQTNVLTNESYSHPDNAWLFESNIWSHTDNETAELNGKTRVHASSKCMGWTTNRMCDDTYSFTFYRVSAAAYNRELDCGSPLTTGPKPVVAPKKPKNKRAGIKATGKLEVTFGDKVVEYQIPATAEKLFERARKEIALNPRTPTRFTSHARWVKRQTMGVTAVDDCMDCSADDITAVITASFWCDVEDELANGAEAWVEKFKQGIRSDNLLSSGDMSGATSALDKGLNLADQLLSAKSTKDGVRKAIGGLRSYMSAFK